MASISDIGMGSSSPNPPPNTNLTASDSGISVKSNLSSPNPPPTPMAPDSRPGNESGFSPPNPSPTTTDYASSNYMAGTRTTYSPLYHPPTGTGYGPRPLYYGSSHPGPTMIYGGPYPGQPSYCPPPRPYHNPAYDAPSYVEHTDCCLCRIIIITILLAASMSIFGYFVNLIYRPKCPSFSLTSATVLSFNTSSSSCTDSSPCTISSDISLSFSIHNPNEHMDISYLLFFTDVSYGFDTIANGYQPTFVQDSMAKTSKVTRLIEVDESVSASTVMGINDDLAKGRVVKLSVRLNALMMFNQMNWFQRELSVFCLNVDIQFVNGTAKEGKMVGPPISCRSELKS